MTSVISSQHTKLHCPLIPDQSKCPPAHRRLNKHLRAGPRSDIRHPPPLQDVMQQLLARGTLKSLPKEVQWSVRMLLPRKAPTSGQASGTLTETAPPGRALPPPQAAAQPVGPAAPAAPAAQPPAAAGAAAAAAPAVGLTSGAGPAAALLGSAALLPLLQPGLQVWLCLGNPSLGAASLHVLAMMHCNLVDGI
jgi:hypothetical protein